MSNKFVPELQHLAFMAAYKDIFTNLGRICDYEDYVQQLDGDEVSLENKSTISLDETISCVRDRLSQHLIGTMNDTITRKMFVQKLYEALREFQKEVKFQGNVKGNKKKYWKSFFESSAPGIWLFLDCVLDDSFEELEIDAVLPYQDPDPKLITTIANRSSSLTKLSINFSLVKPLMPLGPFILSLSALPNLTSLSLHEITEYCAGRGKMNVFKCIGRSCPLLSFLSVSGLTVRMEDVLSLIVVDAVRPQRYRRMPPESLTPLCSTLQHLHVKIPHYGDWMDSTFAFALRHLPMLQNLDSSSMAVKIFHDTFGLIDSDQQDDGSPYCEFHSQTTDSYYSYTTKNASPSRFVSKISSAPQGTTLDSDSDQQDDGEPYGEFHSQTTDSYTTKNASPPRFVSKFSPAPPNEQDDGSPYDSDQEDDESKFCEFRDVAYFETEEYFASLVPKISAAPPDQQDDDGSPYCEFQFQATDSHTAKNASPSRFVSKMSPAPLSITLALTSLAMVDITNCDLLAIIGKICPFLKDVGFNCSSYLSSHNKRKRSLDDDDDGEFQENSLQSIFSSWPKLEAVTLIDVPQEFVRLILTAFGPNLQQLTFNYCSEINLEEVSRCVKLEKLSILHSSSSLLMVPSQGNDSLKSDFLPKLTSLESDICLGSYWSRIFEEKSSLSRVLLHCCHIGTKASDQTDWNSIPRMWPNLEMLFIRNCDGLTMDIVWNIVAQLSGLKTIHLPGKMSVDEYGKLPCISDESMKSYTGPPSPIRFIDMLSFESKVSYGYHCPFLQLQPFYLPQFPMSYDLFYDSDVNDDDKEYYGSLDLQQMSVDYAAVEDSSHAHEVAAVMAAHHRCPLDPKIFEPERHLELLDLVEIEKHCSAPGNCIHPPLKELKFRDGTPLILQSCAEGDLDAVKRMVEHWGVDVVADSTAAIYRMSRSNVPFLRWWIEGATPLFVAAVNGHDAVVRYLVGKGADVSARTTGSQPSDLQQLHYSLSGINPLYGALILPGERWIKPISSPLREKKTDTVRHLLELGANPSTLHKGHFPSWMTHLCNSNTTAISALINHGMQLDQRNPFNGSTVLHHWAANPLCTLIESRAEEESPLAVVKLLIEKGADVLALNKKGFSPILYAAHKCHKLQVETSRESLDILDYLLENEAIDRHEKIDALELIGAIILSDPGKAHLLQTASDCCCWRRALHLREMRTEGARPLLKTAMKRQSGQTVEWITLSELERVIQQPSEHLLQSFLVRFRIYASKSSVVATNFLAKYLAKEVHNFINPLKVQRRFSELLDILWAVLDMILSFQPRKDGQHTWGAASRALVQIVKLLSGIRGDDPIFTSYCIKTSLELIWSSEHRHLLDTHYRRGVGYHMRYLLELFKKLAVLPGEKLNDEIKVLLAALVHLKRQPNPLKQTLLHRACANPRSDPGTIELLLKAGSDVKAVDSNGNAPLNLLLVYLDPKDVDGFRSNLTAIEILLKAGADANAVDSNGNAPLHRLLVYFYPKDVERFRANLTAIKLLLKTGADVNAADSNGNAALHLLFPNFDPEDVEYSSTVRLLLDKGAHLDQVNHEGKTPIDMWTENKYYMNSKRFLGAGLAPIHRLPEWCYETVPKLMCLSSRVIRANKIVYTAETLPVILHKFVEMH